MTRAGKFAPWLFTIARHQWIDRQRAAPPATDDPLPEIAREIQPGERLAQEEDRQQLWRLARACLTENQFQARWLHYAEDMAVPHVARVLGKTRVHVKVLLFRARQTLGRHLNSARTLSQAIPEATLQSPPLNHALTRQFVGDKLSPAKSP